MANETPESTDPSKFGEEHYRATLEAKAEESKMQREYDEMQLDAKLAEAKQSSLGDVETIIGEVMRMDDVHVDVLADFHKKAQSAMDEMAKRVEGEREKKVVAKFGEAITHTRGKYMPAGVDERFRVRVRGGVPFKFWKAGAIYDRVIGQAVDAERFHQIIDGVQGTEDEIDKIERELDQLRAAKKSTKELLKLSGAGFFLKLGTVGIGEFKTAASEAVTEYRAGSKQSAVDKARASILKKRLKATKKQLSKQTDLRERTLKRVDKLRGKNLDMFNRSFGAEIKKLEELKPSMRDDEYVTKLQELKRKVRTYGERRNIPMIESFLEESVGRKIPKAETEKTIQMAAVAKMWHEVTGKYMSKPEIEGMSQYPDIAIIMDQIIYGDKMKDVVAIMKFFFTGKYEGMDMLESKRVVPTTLENFRKFLALMPRYLKRKGDLSMVFNEFASNDYENIVATDFDRYFDDIVVKQVGKIASAQENARAMAIVGDFWKDACGRQPSEPEAIEFFKSVKIRFPNDYMQLLKDKTCRDITGYFITGKYNGKDIVTDSARCFDMTRKNIFDALVRAEKLSLFGNDAVNFVLRVFATHPDYKDMNLSELDTRMFKEIIDAKDAIIEEGIPYEDPEKQAAA